MPIWIPLAIAAGVQTAANIVSNKRAQRVQAENVNRTIAANKEQAEKAYKLEQENIKLQNEYNSPASQMARFTEAGLSKNLVYQQGTPGNQSQIARYNAPNLSYNYIPGFKGESLSPLTQLPGQVASINNLISQGKILQAEGKIKTAISKYADTLAEMEVETKFNESEALKMKRIWSDQEFQSFFYKKDNMWYLKPEASETFVNNLAAKWLIPPTELEKTQANIKATQAATKLQEQILKLQSGALPWLNPLIQFLRLLDR